MRSNGEQHSAQPRAAAGIPAVLQSIMDGSQDLIAAVDPAFRFLAFNSAYQAEFKNIFGPEIAVGLSLLDALDHLPEDQRAAREVWGRALIGERFTITREFGDPARARRWYELRFFPLHDDQGRRLGAAHIVRDVTERLRLETARHEAETALREANAKLARRAAESEERYRELVQSANSAILRWRADGTLTFFNEFAQEFFGWSAEEAIGRHVGLLVPDQESTGADLTGLVRDIVVHPERYVNNVNENVRRDGRRVWMTWTNRAILDERGEVAEILAVGNDVTEQHRRERLLAEQAGLLEMVAAGRPLDECLCALTEAVARLLPGVRAAVVLADAAREAVERAVSGAIPATLGQGIAGARIEELAIGSCAQAMFAGERIVCPDIASDGRWSPAWRELCAAHGIRAAHSTPVFGGGAAVAAFFMVRAEAGPPEEWELRLADFGAHMAALVLERDRAVASLRRSEARLTIAKEAAGLGIHDYDVTTGTIQWDARVRALWGVGPDEPVTFELFMAGLHPDDRAATQAAVERALDPAGAGQYTAEYRVNNRLDGVERWVHATGQVFFERGRAVRLIGTAQDITAQKMAEEAVLQGRATLEAALASMSDAVFISDAAGRFIDFNEAFAAFHRFKDKAECLRTLAEHPDILDVFMTDGTPAPLERWAVPRALRGETVANAEYALRRKDTGETWVGSYSFGPIRDEHGAIVGSVVVGRDVTELKRAEQALRRSEERLRLAQQVARIGSFEFDPRTNTSQWSPELEALHGLPPGGYGGRYEDWAALVHPADLPEVERRLRESLDTGAFETEWRIVRPDGAIRWVAARGQTFKDADGQPLRMVGVNLDITERKAAEEELRQANALLSAISENTKAIIALKDRDSRVVMGNPGLWEAVGKPASEVLGKDDTEFLDPKEAARIIAHDREVMATGRSMSFEEHPRPDLTYQFTKAPYRDEAGNIAGVIVVGTDATERKRTEEALRQSEQRLAEKLETAKKLQQVSTQLIQADQIEALYEQILATATAVLHADCASLQMLHPERGELRLLGHRGLNDEAARFWEWVRPGSESACGVALRDGRRVIVPDVEACEFMAGSADLETYLKTGIRAVQSTPLVSRSGALLGMISTHWREPHEPTTSELRALDVLARQAADLIERKRNEEALRQSEMRLADQKQALELAIGGSPIQEVFKLLVRAAQRQFGQASRAAIFTTDSDGAHLRFGAAVDLPEAYIRAVDGFEIRPDNPACGSAAYAGKAALTADVAKDPLWAPYLQMALENGIRACWSFPIRSSAGKVIGTFAIYHPFQREPEPCDLERMTLLTHTAALAIERHQTETALRESEQRFRLLFDRNPDGVFAVDVSGRFILANAACESISGYSAEELSRKTFMELCAPDQLAYTAEQFQGGLREPQYLQLETALIRKDGRRVELWVAGEAMVNEGNVIGVYCTAKDITERKAAEEALRRSEKRFRALFDHSPDAVFLTIPDGRILAANPAARAMFGMSEEEIRQVGRTGLAAPEDPAWAAVAEERRHSGMFSNRPLTFIRKSGERFIGETSSVIMPGDASQAFVIVRDITERKRAEAELRESRDRLDRAQEIAQLGSWELDVMHNRLTWSDEVYRIFGLQPQAFDATYEAFLERVHPGDRSAVDEAYAGSLREGRDSYEIEHRVIRKDSGEIRIVHEKCEHIRDAAGWIVRSAGMVHDITERKRAEAALRESEARHRRLMSVLPTAVYACDADGVITYYNDTAAGLWGRAPRAGNTDERFCGSFRLWRLDGSPLPHSATPMAVAIREGTSFRNEEVVIERPDGSRITVLVNIDPIRDDQGRIMGAINAFADVSERKRDEEALLRRNERLTLLSDAAAHLLAAEDPTQMVRDLFGRVCRHLNVQAYFNFMVSETGDALRLDSCAGIPDEVARSIERLDFGVAVCGTVAQIRRMIHATGIQASDDPKVQLVKGYGIRAYCCNPLMVGGRLLGTLSFGSCAKDRFEEDEVEFMRTVCHYVAMAKERLRLERELRQHIAELAEADRRKDEFLAMLAHELRNPLAPIRNAAQVLRLAGPAEPRLERQREIIERHVTHMARLLDDLLDASRITRGKITLERQPLALADVLDHAVEVAAPLIKTRRHVLQYAPPSGQILVEGDIDRLAQVFGNLLGNAAKYTDEGGRIELSVSLQGSQALVSVRDNGIGIEPSLLPHVFDLFVQADRAADRSRGGLGIGLTMVHNLVRMHGGSVEAHSDGLGRGSEFVVRLPLLREESVGGNGSAQAPTGVGEKVCRRVLVVDDLTDSADSLGELLELWGCQARVAHSGPDALVAAREFAPEVILLDIGMPGMDGFEAARRLRAEHGAAPVLVALTGYGQTQDREETRAAGFDEHLIKPVDLDALRKLLAGLTPRP